MAWPRLAPVDHLEGVIVVEKFRRQILSLYPRPLPRCRFQILTRQLAKSSHLYLDRHRRSEETHLAFARYR